MGSDPERNAPLMRMSWKLGRVAGIDVFLHPTFLLLLAFVGATQGGLEAMMIVSAAFGCVLLHELGHALMARQYGIETEDITLYPIGGVARLQRMPRSPGAELLIALAGPAVNVALAAGLFALRVFLWPSGWDAPPLAGFLGTLLALNVGLALFNLVPAFPMDGGRVLRALLSGWLGRARATQVAASLGRGLAMLFGAYMLVNGHLWQVFLAVFIYFAAGVELNQVLAEERRREFGSGKDVWFAPPGYRWISRGNGVWQLAPVIATMTDREPPRWP
jgi:Zn-dependent protease